MDTLEAAVQRVFKPLAAELKCEWSKTDERFEKFLELKGAVNLRIYWHFERESHIFVTLVRPRDGDIRSIEISLYLLVFYKTGSENGDDSKMAGSDDPSDLIKMVKKYAVPYLTGVATDIDDVSEWARQRVLQEHPEYAKLKTNKWMRCEWID
jgi:hypothetical protein